MLRLRQLTPAGAISPDITDRRVSIDRTILWRAILSRPPPSALDNPTEIHTRQPMGIESNEVGGVPQQRGSRGRRHVRSHHNHHHPQLMRVGCVLGTCQVQNLSHRLYQLSGQSGREDSSPINPRSPHSYGWALERPRLKQKTREHSVTPICPCVCLFDRDSSEYDTAVLLLLSALSFWSTVPVWTCFPWQQPD